MEFFEKGLYCWCHLRSLETKVYCCGYCSCEVASDRGYPIGNRAGGDKQRGGVYICPNCQGPTSFSPNDRRFPLSAFGRSVNHVPSELFTLYEEARRCTSQNCYTAAVMLCRKMLMNIAVNKGAEKNSRFIEYVNYLSNEGFIPPDGKHWVDHIRKKGNEANHEIELMEESDAKELILFTEMLLRFIYEFPALIPTPDET